MLRKHFLLLLLFLATQVSAQMSLQGTITDAETGEALEGATVTTEDGNIGTVTDELGRYRLTLPEGSKPILIVQFVGYESKKIVVQATGETSITLIPGELLEEVVIRGVRAGSEIPVVQSNLTRREIKKVYRGEHPIYFLSTLTPGILTESESGTSFSNYGTMRLRGLEQIRINFTLNGIPLNDMIDHGVYFSNFTDIANSFESIQVQRGVSTSSNGVASYAGSVNFESVNLEKQEAGSEFQLGYGSYHSSRINGRFNTGMLDNRWAFHANFSRIHSDGYRDHTGSNAYSFFFSGAHFGNRDVIKLNAFDARSRNGLGYEPVDERTLQDHPAYNPLDENDKDDFGQQFIQLQHIHTFSKELHLVSSLYYNGASGDFLWGWRDSTGYLEQYNYPLINRHFGLMSNLHFNPVDKISLTAGIHLYTFRRNNLEEVSPDFANPYYDEHSQKDEISGFIQASYHLGGFTLFGDIAFRDALLTIMPDFDFIGIAHDENLEKKWIFLDPRAGISYRLSPGSNLFVSVGKTSREPTKVDILGGWGLYDSMSYATLKNGIDFLPEQVLDIETGFRHQSPGLRAEINLFYMNFKDGILPIGETIEFGSQVRTNIPESFRTGAEFMIHYLLLTRVHLSANACYLYSRIDELRFTDDAEVYRDIKPAFSPGIIANASISIKIIDAVEVSLSGRYVSSSYMTLRNEPEFMLPAHTLLNGRILINFLQKQSFILEVNNLTSTRYYTNGKPLDTDGDLIPDTPGYFANAPVNLFGTFTFRF
jgi:iron complex outermembrane receptor protein